MPARDSASQSLSCSEGHLWLLIAITILAGLVRAHRLGSPATPVYDESYMGVIVNQYHSGSEHFFDVHPPFSRLLQYYGSLALGYDGSCAYSKHMAWTECLDSMWAMRAVPCALGTLLVPLAYAGCRLHGSSARGALVAALLVATESLFFALSRIHLLDVYTTFCIASVVVLHAAFLRCTFPPHSTTSFTPTGAGCCRLLLVVFLLVADGVMLGAAVSSKFGVAAPTAVWCVACNGLACFNSVVVSSSAQPVVVAEVATAKTTTQSTATPTARNGSSRSDNNSDNSNNGDNSRNASNNNIIININNSSLAHLLYKFLVVSGCLALVAMGTYLALLAWHFALIPWKGAEVRRIHGTHTLKRCRGKK